MIGEEMMRSGHWSVPLESSDWSRNDEVRSLVSSIGSPLIGQEMMRSGHWLVPLESSDWSGHWLVPLESSDWSGHWTAL